MGLREVDLRQAHPEDTYFHRYLMVTLYLCSVAVSIRVNKTL